MPSFHYAMKNIDIIKTRMDLKWMVDFLDGYQETMNSQSQFLFRKRITDDNVNQQTGRAYMRVKVGYKIESNKLHQATVQYDDLTFDELE